jgi:hypothetical protein
VKLQESQPGQTMGQPAPASRDRSKPPATFKDSVDVRLPRLCVGGCLKPRNSGTERGWQPESGTDLGQLS